MELICLFRLHICHSLVETRDIDSLYGVQYLYEEIED